MPKKLPPFRLRFRSEPLEKMCVFRLWAGDKYFIWKGKSFPDAAGYISETIDRLLRKPDSAGKDTVADLVNEIELSRCLYLEVEAVHYPDTPFDLLVLEHKMLRDATGDPKCVNTVFMPHLPKWIPEEDKMKYIEYLTAQI